MLSLSATASAQSTTDYDSDNDGYIDVSTHQQLNAIRHDLNGNGDATHADYVAAFPNRVTSSSGRMGCPSGACTGYELTANIDLDTDGDGNIGTDSGDAYYNSGAGWIPIGDGATRYSGNFKGDGHTINNLFISSTTLDEVGLFGAIHLNARIETLGVLNANITADSYVGALAGGNLGTIVACYTTGKVQGDESVGGLVGRQVRGTISTSYSTAYVNGKVREAGGLVGNLGGGTITNSYSTGRVSGTANHLGGLIGRDTSTSSTITNNYWDTSTSGQTTSAGGSGVVGKTTRQLQTPTGYNGIYSSWNANLDGVTGNDDPWAFGNKMQYPMLDYDGMSTTPQNSQAMGRSDNWNAPIVGERVGVCLANPSDRATVSGQTWKEPWIWERSDTTTDVNHYLRAKVKLTDGAFAYTRNLGGRVKNASGATAGSAITFVSGNTSPRVGTEIVASDPRPSGAVNERFAWQRCDNADTTYTDCEYIVHVWWTDYTPVAADVNKYLRMVVYYATSAGVWTRHATAFTGQVAAASQ